MDLRSVRIRNMILVWGSNKTVVLWTVVSQELTPTTCDQKMPFRQMHKIRGGMFLFSKCCNSNCLLDGVIYKELPNSSYSA